MKKRYLCPVCDQELTAKSYCPECRRIRREPVIYEGWLLPNESGSEGALQQAAEERAGSSVRTGNASAAAGKSFKGFKILVILTVLCSAAAALWEPLWEVGKEIVTDIREEFGVGDSWDSAGEALEALETEEDGAEISGNGLEDNYTVLSEEEVRAAGEPCNGHPHYDVDGEEYIARLSRYIGDLWPEETGGFEWQESYNQIYQRGLERYSYYERRAECFLGNGVYYVAACDTATGEVMEVDIGAETEEEFAKAFLLAACALEPDLDRNGVWSETQSLLSAMEGEEYYFGDWGIHEIYLTGGTSYYGSLSCLSQYDKYQ